MYCVICDRNNLNTPRYCYYCSNAYHLKDVAICSECGKLSCVECDEDMHDCVGNFREPKVYDYGYEILLEFCEQKGYRNEFKVLGAVKTLIGDIEVVRHKHMIYISWYKTEKETDDFKRITRLLSMKRYMLPGVCMGLKEYNMRNKNSLGHIMRFFLKLRTLDVNNNIRHM
jgi:hypothetical protein